MGWASNPMIWVHGLPDICTVTTRYGGPVEVDIQHGTPDEGMGLTLARWGNGWFSTDRREHDFFDQQGL